MTTELVDLTYPVHEGMFKYPSDPMPKIKRKAAEQEGTRFKSGYSELAFRNHHGTHVDFPSHKIPNGKNSDAYEIRRFMNDGFLWDLSYSDLTRRSSREVKVEDFEERWRHFSFPNVGGLVIYTGFCDEMAKYEGKLSGQEKTDFESRFPYLTEEVANWIIKRFKQLKIIGIDSFSIDKKGSNSEAHRTFLSQDILVLETLVNLKKLRERLIDWSDCTTHASGWGTFGLYSMPIKITKADAAQTRAYATGGWE